MTLLYVPAGHGIGLLLCAGQYVNSGHAVHPADPTVG
jgi:hypothetical protein